MNFEQKINELKIKLPEAKAPVGSYMATKISGKLLFISGQISTNVDGELIKGKIGKELGNSSLFISSSSSGVKSGIKSVSVSNSCSDRLSKDMILRFDMVCI
mgnify:CR=1 FL=1